MLVLIAQGYSSSMDDKSIGRRFITKISRRRMTASDCDHFTSTVFRNAARAVLVAQIVTMIVAARPLREKVHRCQSDSNSSPATDV
jgi:hypothetical protein